MNFAGFNCSLPHKVAVIELLDGLGESAAIMQAVNCVVRRERKYIGENTDGKGFLASLQTVMDPTGKRMTLLGAGGAARAIAVETALAGLASICVVNRDRQRGQRLAQLINERTGAQATYQPWDNRHSVSSDTDVLVNATSVGLYPRVEEQLPLHIDSLRPELVVADVIPNPLCTRLISDAESRGCTVIDGLGMLVNQGVISIKYWTGEDVDPDVMRNRVIEVLGLSS